MTARYRRVTLAAPGWRLDDVSVPRTFATRLRGLRRGRSTAMLLPAGSAHTFGMPIPIRMVPITAHGVVQRSFVVPPRSIRRFGDASWILEVSASVVPPPLGARLTVVPSS